MRDDNKPRGLKQRGQIWWIDKIVRTGDQTTHLCESTGTSSLAEAASILAARVRALTQAQARIDPTERTFREAAVEYVLSLEDRGKDTARAELDISMIDASIGGLPLSRIHQLTIRPWIEAQRGHRSSGTVGRTLRTVTAVLTFAARVLRDGDRPWLGIAVPKLIAPDWGSVQPYRLSWEDQDRLVEALPSHLVAPILFAVSTGARELEITTLQWEQHRAVDGVPEFGAWWIPPEIRKGNARRRASDQQGRYLVCNQMARSIIASQSRESAWVFPSPLRDGPLDRLNNHGWRHALKAIGVEMRLHDLRHTFGERLASAGVPFDARKTILGHHHGDITAHYSTPGLARLIEEVDRVTRPGSRPAAVLSDNLGQSAKVAILK